MPILLCIFITLLFEKTSAEISAKPKLVNGPLDLHTEIIPRVTNRHQSIPIQGQKDHKISDIYLHQEYLNIVENIITEYDFSDFSDHDSSIFQKKVKSSVSDSGSSSPKRNKLNNQKIKLFYKNNSPFSRCSKDTHYSDKLDFKDSIDRHYESMNQEIYMMNVLSVGEKDYYRGSWKYFIVLYNLK